MLRLSKKGDYSVFLMATLARQELLHRGELGSCSALFTEPRVLGPSQLNQKQLNPKQPPSKDFDSGARDGIPTMSAHELSKLSGLGRSYVANLLKDFAKAGLLTSIRGQQGGYRLAKPPEAISLRETLAVIEGPLRFVGCADHSAQSPLPQNESCDLMNICPSVGPMQVIHNRILHLLEDLSLAELAKSGIPQPQMVTKEPSSLPSSLPSSPQINQIESMVPSNSTSEQSIPTKGSSAKLGQ